jgi:vanillate O-demethylase ferredoxin subunit
MSSCEQGVCGTCLTRVLDGAPDHRDQYLTPEEQAEGDQFLPCCSRARSPRLVLDL